MQRLYLHKSIQELEELVNCSKDPSTLTLLAEELKYRKTPRAKALINYIQSLSLEIVGAHTELLIDISEPCFSIGMTLSDNEIEIKLAQEIPEKIEVHDLEKFYKENSLDLTNPVVARLAGWCALEALSPQTYQKPESLGKEGQQGVANLADGLPWLKDERPRKNYTLYYEVILGAIDMDIADTKLADAFGQTEEKQRPSKNKAVIASILVDKNGYPVPDACAISSFAWALPLTLKRKLEVLNNWPQIEDKLKSYLYNACSPKDKEGRVLPLTSATIFQVYEWLLEQLQIPKELASRPEFCLRQYHYYKSKEAPECSVLNSFFIEDLQTTLSCYLDGSTGKGLKQYIGEEQPNNSYDLLKNIDALEQVLSPNIMPVGKWPMGSDRALALLQQAAVNIITHKNHPIISVNGPPGTGKTTLLRDIIADIIIKRATALSEFADPLHAFETSGVKIPAGDKGFWQVYKLDPKIKGYEILVASSNNAAVENISHELPDKKAVAREEATYFRTISNAIAAANQENETENGISNEPIESWGLIAAALGNMKNRTKFWKVFWWHEDAAMRLYLKAAKGNKKASEEKSDKITESKIPSVIINEDVPENRDISQKKWEKIRKEFSLLQQEIKDELAAVEEVRMLCIKLRQEKLGLKQASQNFIQAGEKLSALMPPEHAFARGWPDIMANLEGLIHSFIQNKQNHPAWYHKVLPFAKGKNWRLLHNAYRTYCLQHTQVKASLHKIETKKIVCGKHLIDEAFFERSHQEKQTATPWLPESLHKKREDLFLLAMKVHKAFIDVAAQKILHNLSVLSSPANLPIADRKDLMGELWSTLFLVVPVLSTTFASVKSMLGDLPPESFGWLLIDEAGQASPQYAVGAIMRAKKTVIVGDPIQIPPVVTLPEKLVTQVLNHFCVNSERWAAPKASAQTLADHASHYKSFFETDIGNRMVGIPLLVHRRCENPMFSISNEVAYNNYMVSQVKETDGGEIRRALGSSQWFPINGQADTKWCPDEGELVIQLLKKLQDHNIQKPDIFIVTPFRIVADEMRKRLRKEKALLQALGLDTESFAKKCVGTVHTVQGREADSVILLLGAPNASQNGARRWAATPENLLNVAVSRAKRNLYVVGSRDAWARIGSFSILSKHL